MNEGLEQFKIWYSDLRDLDDNMNKDTDTGVDIKKLADPLNTTRFKYSVKGTTDAMATCSHIMGKIIEEVISPSS